MKNKWRPTFTKMALDRLKEVGEEDILAYFKSLPPGSIKSVSKLLPSLPGFRPGTEKMFERQFQALAHKLSQGGLPKSFAGSKDEVGLYVIWRTWSKHKLLPATVTDSLLQELESKIGEERSDVQTKAMAHALTSFVGASEVGREVLNQFVTMSPFGEVAKMMEIVQQAKTVSEIEATEALKELPTRLQKDEGVIHDLEVRITKAEDALKEALTTNSREASELDEHVEKLAKLEETAGADATKLRELATTLEEFSGLINNQAKKIDSLEASLSESLRLAADEARRIDLRLEDLEKNVLHILEYGPRLVALENSKIIGSRSIGANAVDHAKSRRFSISTDSSKKPTTLDTIEATLVALKAALHSQGLSKSSAEQFALEILAAVSAKQAIFFRGAFARDVSAACAKTFAASAVVQLSIALGATEPWSSAVNSLWNEPALENKAVVAVIVENVNNAAMTISFDGIADILSSQTDDGRPATVVFGTLVDSPAAFPLEKLYLRLGPVFDLDLMDWRGKRKLSVNPSEMTPNAISGIFGFTQSEPIDFEETRRLTSTVAGKRDPQFERVVDDAFSALSRLRSKSTPATAIQSLQFGWLIPYWLMRSPHKQELDTEIDGGRCDGTKVDDRLKRVLDECGNGDDENE